MSKPVIPDITAVMNLTAGRRYVWNLLQSCGVFGAGFHQDPSINAYNQGRRDVGLEIQSTIMDIDFDAYVLMLNENGKVPVDSI